MPLVVMLHTFRNRIEGSVKQGQIMEIPAHRERALRMATPGRPLVRVLTAAEIEQYRQHGKLGDPKAKVEPDSRPPSPRPAPISNDTLRPKTPTARDAAKVRTKAPPKVRRRGKQPEEPEAPRPLARGSRTGQPTESSSSLAAPPPRARTSGPRGTRTPRSGGSPSTTPTT